MGKAAGASGDFAGRTPGALDRVNAALSGTAAKIGEAGVTLSLGAAAKEIIDIDHRMTRLGLTANAGAEQVAKLKQQILKTAQSPDIKIDPKEVLSGLEVVMEKVGDMRFVEDNIRNIGLAIQATGESGGAMGDVFSEFAKFGCTAEQVNKLLDDMVAQGGQGAFTFAEFAKNAPAVFSAYSVIGTSPEHAKNAYAAMQILVAGTKSPEIAVTTLNSAMGELADPDKQKKLGRLGIAVRDGAGQFRDFNGIMFDIVNKAKEMGNADYFGTIFGSLSMNAVRSYQPRGSACTQALLILGTRPGSCSQKRRKWRKH
jgi:TP901 family phage tail tape measure protein